MDNFKPKQTSKYKFPEDWNTMKLGDILSLEYGKGLPENERLEGKFPVYGSNGVIGYHEQFLLKGPGIVVGRKGTIGAVTWVDSDFWPIDTTYFVKTKNENVFLKWLFFKLKQSNLPRLSQSDVVLGLKRELVYHITIPLPPLPEQRRIAEVLGTVDDAIQKVSGAIESTERLKRGLMQRLLKRGIGHERFKDSEVGRVPEEWEVVRLGDESITEIRGNKTINKFERVAFVPMEFVSDSDIFVKYETRPMKDVKSFTYCERGDLLLAKITPSLENGKQGIIPDSIPNGFALATTEVFPISCKGIDRFFLFYVLKFPKFRNKIISSMIGTTGRQRASKESVEKLQIPLPPLPEQHRIAGILSTVDRKLELECRRKEKLERMKKGLMNDC